MGVGCQRDAPTALPPGTKPGTRLQETAWLPGPVWTGAENLAPTGIRSPERPASSESLCWLSYRGPPYYSGRIKIRKTKVGKTVWTTSPRRLESLGAEGVRGFGAEKTFGPKSEGGRSCMSCSWFQTFTPKPKYQYTCRVLPPKGIRVIKPRSGTCG